MREKLIEFIRKADKEDYLSRTQGEHYAYMADHLIANGVTFGEDINVPSKWISVKDRLPTEEDASDGGFVLANTEEKVIIALWSDVCRFSEFVTHWMPLPEMPKEG